jgi:four helix bundle protein
MSPDFADRTFAFACDIVHFYTAAMRLPRFPYGIARQVLASGTSIGANIEESRAPASRRDLTAKFVVALKEARDILTVSVRNLRG